MKQGRKKAAYHKRVGGFIVPCFNYQGGNNYGICTVP